MPAGADLAAAFSIQASAKPAAIVRWAIEDGPHKNMQAGKKDCLGWLFIRDLVDKNIIILSFLVKMAKKVLSKPIILTLLRIMLKYS